MGWRVCACVCVLGRCTPTRLHPTDPPKATPRILLEASEAGEVSDFVMCYQTERRDGCSRCAGTCLCSCLSGLVQTRGLEEAVVLRRSVYLAAGCAWPPRGVCLSDRAWWWSHCVLMMN